MQHSIIYQCLKRKIMAELGESMALTVVAIGGGVVVGGG